MTMLKYLSLHVESEAEQQYLKRANQRFMLILAIQLPAFIWTALFFNTSVLLAVSMFLLFMAGPIMLHKQQAGVRLVACSLGVATMCMSGLLIHLGRGMIEMHFHVFVMLALLISLINTLPILVAAVTIALHHILFWLFLPSSVFSYDASFYIVLLHAVFVVFQSAASVPVAEMIKKMVITQASAFEHMQSVSQHLLGEFSSQSKAMLHAVEEQQASLGTTVNSINELTSHSESTSTQALQAAQMAKASVEVAESGSGIVRQMNDCIDQNMKSSEAIRAISNTIEEIAFQTNILSLNAAVEAARAGEAGKGFSVVAEEVRSLAGRASQAARQTSEIIDTSMKNLENGSQLGGKVQESFDAILEKFQQLNDSIQHIADANSTQHTTINAMRSNIDIIENEASALSTQANNSSDLADNITEEILALTDLRKAEASGNHKKPSLPINYQSDTQALS